MTVKEKDLLDISNEDLVRYFSGTYVKILPDNADEFRYYQIGEINGSGKKAELSIHQDDQNYQFWLLKDLHFDFSFPQSGFYQIEDETVYYAQRPQRQSQKGLNYNSHKLLEFYHLIIRNLPRNLQYFSSNTHLWSCSSLNKIFLKEDLLPIEPKISSVFQTQCMSKALSNDFAISLGVTSKKPQLWFRENIIGRFESPDQITISDDLFLQEAVDFFPQNNIEVILQSSGEKKIKHHDEETF